MATSKVDRSKYGPGMGEVVLGAALSLTLGAMVAMGILVAKPVQAVKQVPKDAAPGSVYYIEGTKGGDAGKQWMRKRQLFTEGSTVSLNEDELNLWITSTMGAAKAGAKPAPGAPLLEMGPPNFRIADGKLQVASQCMLNLDWFGVKFPVVVQAAGHFAKTGGDFSLVPDEFFVGSCPLHRVPVVGAIVFDQVLGRIKPPSDLAAAWKKLAGVSIDAKTLKLTMP